MIHILTRTLFVWLLFGLALHLLVEFPLAVAFAAAVGLLWSIRNRRRHGA